MSLDGNGTYSPPAPQFPAIPNTIIYADDFNQIILDIATALSTAIFRDGQAAFTADQSLGGNKLTNVKNGTNPQDATTVLQVFTDPVFVATTLQGFKVTGSMFQALMTTISMVASGTLTLTGATLLDASASGEVRLPANTSIGPISASELATLDGITATTAELNKLHGATLSTAELNILTGAVITVMELNCLQGVTANVQSQIDTKAPVNSPTLTGVPTAPTAPTGTNTNQLATMAALQAQAFAATLPNQAGNAGKYVTTNGVDASWAAIPGQGGTTASGSVVLTSASGGAQAITPTTNGQSVTLPDATTLVKGITLYAISNKSDKYQIGIRDAGGTLRDVIAPGGFCLCGLVANTTAAGSWVFSNNMSDSMLMLGEAVRSKTYTNNPNSESVLLGSSVLTLAQSGTQWYVQAYDTTNNTLGTPVLVVSAPTYNPRIVALTATTALCFYRTAGGATLNAVVVSVSGSTCSLGSVSSAASVLDSYSSGYNTSQFIALSDTTAVVTIIWNDGSTYRYSMVAISVSTTTATMGTTRYDLSTYASPSLSNANAPALIYAESSTKVFHCWCTGLLNTLEANVFTITGTTIAAGTGASFAYDYTQGTCKGLAIQAGKHFISWYDGSTLKCRIYTISGTVVTANATFDTTLNGTSSQFAQLIAYSATKIFYHYSSTSPPITKYGVLSESAGTLSTAVAPTAFSTTLLGDSFSGFIGGALYSATAAGSNRITYDGDATIAHDAAIPLGRNSAKAGTYLGTIGSTLLFSGLAAFKNGLFNEFSSSKFISPTSVKSLGGNKIAFWAQVAPSGEYAAYTCEVAQ